MSPVYFKTIFRPPLFYGLILVALGGIVFSIGIGRSNPDVWRYSAEPAYAPFSAEITLDRPYRTELSLPNAGSLRLTFEHQTAPRYRIEFGDAYIVIDNRFVELGSTDGPILPLSPYPHVHSELNNENEWLWVFDESGLTEIWLNREIYWSGEISLGQEPGLFVEGDEEPLSLAAEIRVKK